MAKGFKIKGLVFFAVLFSFLLKGNIQNMPFDNISEKIVVRGDYLYPPYEYINDIGEPDGFNVEVFKAIAKELNLDYELSLDRWSVVRNQLEEGEIDVLVGAMVSPERSNKILFGTPHSVVPHAIFAHSTKPEYTIDSLYGKKIVVQEDDMMHDFILENSITDDIVVVDNQLEALKIIDDNLADAAFIGLFQGIYILQEHNLKNVVSHSANIAPQSYAMAVSKGNEELLWYLNMALYQLKETGRYDEIYSKWFSVYEDELFIEKYRNYFFILAGIILFLLWTLFYLRYKVKKGVARIREVEGKIIEEQQKLIAATDQGPASIIITDVNGVIEYVNKKFIKTVNYSKEELIGVVLRLFRSGHLCEQERQNLFDTLNRGDVWRGEHQNRNKTGDYYWESVIISPVKNEQEKIVNFVVVGEDITAIKKMQENIMAAKEKAEQSDKLKSVFINNLSHEVRTPLNAIMGFTEIVADDYFLPEKRKEYARTIIKSSKQLLYLMDNLMNISVIESGELQILEGQTDINRLLNDLYNQLIVSVDNESVMLRINSMISQREGLVYSDYNKVLQILLNLGYNAIKYTGKGVVEIGCDRQDDYLIFSVSDEGEGISIDQQHQIFEFFNEGTFPSNISNTKGGMGLGLSIVKYYVDALKGRVYLESQPKSGSVFYFEIPYKPVDTPVDKDIVKEIPDLRNKTILVVDDVDINYMMIEEMLADTGLTILYASNGKTAVDMVESNPDIDMIFMDIKMPVMNGYEATSYIKKERPHIIVIAQTAYALVGDKEKALEAGCDDYLPKPVSQINLINILNKYFGEE
ncbi:transporter substrate-binding domain-containing protein [Marinilabiliaceae bacterium ANBcel2]|nr:transporter substrate-binding domain-containing protein [Marinilabiliaceae bacterium ANBcel2]